MGSVNDVQFYPNASEPIGKIQYRFTLVNKSISVSSVASDKAIYLGEIQPSSY